MKAIRVHENGGPEVLRHEEIDIPQPGPGQVRIRISAAGVNFIDIYHRTGLYPLTLPYVPGQEAAGIVDQAGEGVTELKEGDRVAYAPSIGAYAQYSIVPAKSVVAVPEGVPDETAAAVMLQGMTAHYLSHSTFPLEKGQRCLIHAAAGGVGRLLVQMAKHRGAVVYGTVGSQEKAQAVRALGADEVILYKEVDFASEVARLTKGSGVEVVYDSVGQSTLEGSLKSLRPRGLLVSFGQSSGPIDSLDPRRLAVGGSLFLTRPTLHHYIATREELLWRSEDLFRWISNGELRVAIDSRFPLEQAADAHKRIESRKSSGKILLIP